MREAFRLLKRTFQEWKADRCSSMAAALSYYTVFSLPPLLLLVLTVLGLVVNPSEVQGRIGDEISGLVGPEGAAQVQQMIRNVERPDVDITVLSVAGIPSPSCSWSLWSSAQP